MFCVIYVKTTFLSYVAGKKFKKITSVWLARELCSRSGRLCVDIQLTTYVFCVDSVPVRLIRAWSYNISRSLPAWWQKKRKKKYCKTSVHKTWNRKKNTIKPMWNAKPETIHNHNHTQYITIHNHKQYMYHPTKLPQYNHT